MNALKAAAYAMFLQIYFTESMSTHTIYKEKSQIYNAWITRFNDRPYDLECFFNASKNPKYIALKFNKIGLWQIV